MGRVADPRRFTYLLSTQIHFRHEATDDDAIAALALRQEGIVGRSQLLDLAIHARSIHCRLRRGNLRRLYPGVYAVGHNASSFPGRAFAAVLAVSPNAAASHVTALALKGLCEPPDGAIHVTCSRQRRQPRRGLIVHRAALPAGEIEMVGAVPTTTLPRAFLDLSATWPRDMLRRSVKDAEFQDLIALADLEAILNRHPRRRGRRALASIVNAPAARVGRTRSTFEDLFVEFCLERGLPAPETNVVLRVGGRRMEIDCMWRREGVVVGARRVQGPPERAVV